VEDGGKPGRNTAHPSAAGRNYSTAKTGKIVKESREKCGILQGKAAIRFLFGIKRFHLRLPASEKPHEYSFGFFFQNNFRSSTTLVRVLFRCGNQGSWSNRIGR
jgi:hypothetical protein